jgi:two pore calcium channel protein 3
MPAYDLNPAYAIFFIAFMIVNLYIFINIILATIYTNYKKHLKVEVSKFQYLCMNFCLFV